MTFIGSMIPGVGLIAAGKRRAGGLVLGFLLFLGLIAAIFVVLTPTAQLASYGGDRELLLYAGYGLGGMAALWVLIALISHRSLEPRDLTGRKRFLGATMVIFAASIVVAPMAVAAKNALTQRDLISAISSGHEDSQTVPDIENKANPWKNIPRLNILLLGGDTGGERDEERLGIRPDTQIVASIDTKTGETTLISLPRNLGKVPFPEDSELADDYPYGFTGDGDPNEWILNAVYKNVPATHPDVSGSDANKWAVEGALGIDIDYYMMVDLDGFEAIVTAIGGVDLDVEERTPINYGEPDSGCLGRADYIEPGTQHLNGEDALAFARSRCGGDNYTRMDNQQVVLDSIISSAKPDKLLLKYQSLAGAAERMVKTDIDPDLFPAIIELTVKVQSASVEDVTLDEEFFIEHGGQAADPDYDAVHAAVKEALGSGATDDPADNDDEGDSTTADDEAPGSTATDDTADDESDGGDEWSD